MLKRATIGLLPLLLFVCSIAISEINLNDEYIIYHLEDRGGNAYSVFSQKLGKNISSFKTLCYSYADTNVLIYEEHTSDTGMIVRLTLSPKIVTDTIYRTHINEVKWRQNISGRFLYANEYLKLALPIELDIKALDYIVDILKLDTILNKWNKVYTLNNVTSMYSSGDSRQFYFLGPFEDESVEDYMRPFIIYDTMYDSLMTLAEMPNMIYRVYRKSINDPIYLVDHREHIDVIYKYNDSHFLLPIDTVYSPEVVRGIYGEDGYLMILIKNNNSGESYHRKSIKFP